MIRVLVISEVRLYREGLLQLLRPQQGLDVVGGSAVEEDLGTDITVLSPDVVVLDMAMPAAYARIRQIQQIAPNIRIVGLGVQETEEHVLACAEAGITGYVSRDASVDTLVAAIKSAVVGDLHCSPRIASVLLRRVATLTAITTAHSRLERLTKREREIYSLIDIGLSNKEIAGQLGIEVATVKNHVHNVLEKLNVHRRLDAIRISRPQNMFSLPDDATRSIFP